ncbi:MAG: putative sugar nucleotidyl transferase [Gemmatimonadota bacterium]|nr:putative sugar nucleotidyl transferase [Gemmatimonadota bacterium]
MTERLILFEDERGAAFEPVALTRSVASLRSGALTARERAASRVPGLEAGLLCRGALAATESASGVWGCVNGNGAGAAFFLSAAGALSPDLASLPTPAPGEALLADGRFIAARADADAAARIVSRIREILGDGLSPDPVGPDWGRILEECGLSVSDFPLSIPSHAADLMANAPRMLAEEFAAPEKSAPPVDPVDFPGVSFVRPERVRLAEGVTLAPGVVVDATDGPVSLGPGTRVGANAVLTGPVGIGAGSVVNPAARLLHGVATGPACKLGGEVEQSVLLGYSNKQHDGFLGHSYLGCWVNLGAATDTSDLKNDYGAVKITLCGSRVDTGSRHVGSIIGDHSKTGIHTMLNTGTVLGVSANVFGAGYPPTEIPSFVWGGPGDWADYRVDKALQVAAVVTARRGISFGKPDEELLRRVRDETATPRKAWLEGRAREE